MSENKQVGAGNRQESEPAAEGATTEQSATTTDTATDGNTAEDTSAASVTSSPPAASTDKVGGSGAGGEGSAASESPPPRRTGGGNGLLWLLVLVLLVAVGYLGWQHWLQQEVAPQDTRDLSSQVEQRLTDVDASLESMRREFEAGLARSEQRAEVREQDLRDRVREQDGRLNDFTRTERSDWLLTEADYLVRLASQRLLVDRDAQVAIGLLENADQILRELDESEFHRVREAIASDLTALRMVERVDRSGLYLRLEAIQESVAELPLERHEHQLGERLDLESGTETVRADEGRWWQRPLSGLRDAWDHLDGYIRIYRRDEPLQPLLSPDEELYLRLNLRLMLEQAQLALLQEQPEIYTTSLGKANDWLDNYFVNDDRTRALQAELSTLSEKEVTQSVPELAASLTAMREVIRARPAAGARSGAQP